MLPFWLNMVGRTGTGIGLPWSRASLGLGSKVSTCDTPPDMKQKITLRARGRNDGRRGAKGNPAPAARACCIAAEVAAFSAHLSDLARDHGVQGDGGTDAEVAVWADLAQSLFCLKEFVHVH